MDVDDWLCALVELSVSLTGSARLSLSMKLVGMYIENRNGK